MQMLKLAPDLLGDSTSVGAVGSEWQATPLVNGDFYTSRANNRTSITVQVLKSYIKLTEEESLDNTASFVKNDSINNRRLYDDIHYTIQEVRITGY